MSDIRKSLNNIDDIAFAVKRMVRRNEKLEADNRRLRSLVADVINDTGDDPEIMAASRAEWAHLALVAEAKLSKSEALLAKAMLALDEAIYLLDPDDEDIAKETGLYRIVTTYKELKGESDER